jgi:hypothetical protein
MQSGHHTKSRGVVEGDDAVEVPPPLQELMKRVVGRLHLKLPLDHQVLVDGGPSAGALLSDHLLPSDGVGVISDAPGEKRTPQRTLIEEVPEELAHPGLVVYGDAGRTPVLHPDGHHWGVRLGEGRPQVRPHRVGYVRQNEHPERLAVANEVQQQI